MIFGIIISSISLLLDALLSGYIPIFINNNNLFIPMFTVISLIIIFPYFNNDEFSYLKVCALFGLIYDVLFTNTLGLNIVLFIILGFIINFLDGTLSNSLISIIIKMLVVIIIFDSLTYLILLMLDYINYGILVLLKKILKSLTLNFIYFVILHFFTNIIAKKYRIRKTN